MGQVATVFGGSGYGYGYESGYGDGYGDGDGDGGYGYGDGGDGDGDGYGDGYGYGYAYGDGYIKAVAAFAAGERAEKLVADGAQIAVWRSNADGTPANGGALKPAQVGDIQEVSGPLELCTDRCLHATLEPAKWKGNRWWVVALYPPVIGDANKFGSLKREILADLGECPYP